MTLQGSQKSFGAYVKAGYEFASGKRFPLKSEKLLKEISAGLDDSVLVLDDIIDSSKIRNGKKCMYTTTGIPSAIIYAERCRFEAIQKAAKLAELMKVNKESKIRLFQTIHDYFFDLYNGEQIIASSNKSDMFENYFLAVRLFTGSHIAVGFAVGQLLANKYPDKKLQSIAFSLGVIRQMNDDVQDYFEQHHEPFGDFLSSNNRIPELLFTKNGGSRKSVLELVKRGKLASARKMVLNEKVKESLAKLYDDEVKKIKSQRTAFSYAPFLEQRKGY